MVYSNILSEEWFDLWSVTTYVLVVCKCFFYLDLLQNDAIVPSQSMHYIFCRGRELKLYDKSVLPVMIKRKEGTGEMDYRPLDEKWTRKPLFCRRSK